MPIFSYFCDDCEVEFEELLTQSEEIIDYVDWHPCPTCKERAERVRVNSFAFKFAGAMTGESGAHGNSGVHDHDYPTLDKAVGRSAETKWTGIKARKAKLDKVRKETGQYAVSTNRAGDVVVPTDKNTILNRQKAINLKKKAVE